MNDDRRRLPIALDNWLCIQQKCGVKQPNQKLVAFARVHLEAGEKKVVSRELSVERTAIYDVNQHKFVVEPGMFDVMAGSSSKDIRSRAQYEIVR
jgi:beta-glucosidase